jgi:hypothetical protein
MTLWLPLLDFARSYSSLVQRVTTVVKKTPCIETYGLDRGQIAAFQIHGHLRLIPAGNPARCDWLLVDRDALNTLPQAVNLAQWVTQDFKHQPSDRDDDVLLYRLQPKS